MSAPQESINTASQAEKGVELERKNSNHPKVDHDSGSGSDGHDLDIKGETSEEVGGIFGGAGGKDYRVMTRWGTIFALLTNQFGIGSLGLPSAFMQLGLIPGLITLAGTAVVSWYTGFELYRYSMKHPHCVHIIDLAKEAGGRPWQIIVAIGFLIQVIMCCSSATVTISIAFNTMTNHSICTVAFMAVASIISYLLCVPRTVKFISQSGPPTVISLIGAVLIVMISLGVADPVGAPENWSPTIKVTNNPGFRTIINSVLKIVFAYAGNHTYVSYMAEMRDPRRDFPFALTWLVGLTTVFYATLAIGIYCLAGEYTKSPALGSAPLIPSKAAYGVVLPAILTAALANGHVGIKYMFIVCMKQMKATHEITANTVKSWGAWMFCATLFWIIAFILANAIPIFDSIVSIQSATTYAWFSFGMSGVFYMVSNKDVHFQNWRKISLFIINLAVIGFAFFLNGGGLWASVTEMLDLFASGDGVNGCFSCGDNS
ncbi:hypothetical protein NW762_013630 [Fusarium torreyae]|uniref:Amino acid transporter transmembrane domain-containing protein n=1 Tax=Fusarium torreyae TaxID=1237075 RepID=A0A9W8V797_9HYPO|nr:hypothetical protein NW762_013630 [Fusarium torreyae]